MIRISCASSSGTFRDLIEQLDFIIGGYDVELYNSYPFTPPTTYARMGRYSPAAALDLFDVDPALAEFDRATTNLLINFRN